MKLLINNYEDELARLAQTAVEIKVLIAFLTEGGLSWLPEDRAPIAEFIVGIDLGITSPGALKTLQQRGACVRVFCESGKMFHPKAIYLRSDTDEILIVGSNNLTSGGIASNHEVSLSVHRNESSQNAFGDFLAHFNWLKGHACCGIPDDRFFENYKQTTIRHRLEVQLKAQDRPPLQAPIVKPMNEYAHISTLGDFLRLFAARFPRHGDPERRSGGTTKTHPLKVLNDKEFLPLFKDIVSRVSHGRLTGHSQLNIGGNWYRIPNILAFNKDREPWEHVDNRGRVALQIHFANDLVSLSAVLQYNLHRSAHAAQMPPPVDQRFRKLLEHVENASTMAKLDLPVFRHWNYKDKVLWSKPLMTFEHSLESLPNDEVLLSDLECLANVVDGASSIS
jgi:hypothetical protein